MRERIVLYTSKMIAAQIDSGDDYDVIKQVISIVITGEILIPEHNEYHDTFTYYSSKTKTQFTDLTEIHTLELPKLPKESDGSDLYDWLEFINADSEEELSVIAQKSPQMKAPVDKLLEINQSVEARMLFEAREKQRRDNMAKERRARQEGEREGIIKAARKMLSKKMSIDDIMDVTELPREEIEALSKVQ